MVNKIKMKAVFIVLFLTSLSCSTSKMMHLNSQKTSVFEIDFQDFFVDDIISLNLNKCLILKDIKLFSDKSTGLTDLQLKAYIHDKNKLEIKFKKSAVLCDFEGNKFNLSIFLNNTIQEYSIDITKGKYLGFSKGANNKLLFKQAMKPFVYD